jgi:hypothetical protein
MPQILRMFRQNFEYRPYLDKVSIGNSYSDFTWNIVKDMLFYKVGLIVVWYCTLYVAYFITCSFNQSILNPLKSLLRYLTVK